jgi:hypothetical protein
LKRVLVIAAVALAVAVGVLAFLGGASEESPALAPRAADPPPQAEPSPLASAPVEAHGVAVARLSGRVLRRGAAIDGARVAVRDEAHVVEVRSGADGGFAIEGLAPGRYVVSASLGAEASAVAGPMLLGPGQAREGLVLELLPAASVTGVVLDALSRRPVPGAQVRSSGGQAVADGAGRFRLEALPAGDTWIEAQAKGYLGRVEWLTLAAAREHSGMELFLRAAGLLKGTVTRAGAPVAAASVWGEPLSPGAPVRQFGPVTTRGDGTFELWACCGAVQLAAAAPGASRVEGPRLTLGEGAGRDGLTIELGQDVAAEGEVWVDGKAREGVALYLLDGKSQKGVGATTSRAGGRFRFEGVAPGSYLVQAEVDRATAQRGPFDFTGEPGEPWRIELSSERALSGRVVPAAAGVIVRWRSSEWAGEANAQTMTDAKGAFRFDAVAEGPLNVEAEGEAGTAQATAVAGSEVVLQLRRARLNGLVVNEQGHSVTDFTVRLTPLGGGATRSFPVLSPTGDFSLSVPPGRYEVTATAAGYGEAETPLTVEVGAGEPFVKLVLLGTVPVRGRVRDAATGAPVASVEVVFNRMGRDRRKWAGRWATVLTAADGSFEAGSVPSDAVLTFRKAGYFPLWTGLERLPRGADGAVEVPLRRGEPGQSAGYEPYEGIGAQLGQAPGKVLVAFAFEGSPAEAAGLLPGDQITSVDGRPAAGLELPALIARIMGPAGTVVRLGILRGDQAFEVQVRRRAIQF